MEGVQYSGTSKLSEDCGPTAVEQERKKKELRDNNETCKLSLVSRGKTQRKLLTFLPRVNINQYSK